LNDVQIFVRSPNSIADRFCYIYARYYKFAPILTPSGLC